MQSLHRWQHMSAGLGIDASGRDYLAEKSTDEQLNIELPRLKREAEAGAGVESPY